MSTLTTTNYENHRPHSMIYQNLEVVLEASAPRNALVLIGESAGGVDPNVYKGLIPINSISDINTKLRGGSTVNDSGYQTPTTFVNELAEAATYALTAGGGQSFYCVSINDTTVIVPLDVLEKTIKKVTDTEWTTVNSQNSAYNAFEQLISILSTHLSTVSTELGIDYANSDTDNTDGVTYVELGFNAVPEGTGTEGNWYTAADKASLAFKIRNQMFHGVATLTGVTSATIWEKAMLPIKNSDKSMFLCPLTYNVSLQNIVKATATKLSTPDNQKWKRVYAPVPADTLNVDDDITDVTLNAETIDTFINAFGAYAQQGDDTNQRTMNIWTAGAQIATTDDNGNLVTQTLPNKYVAAGIAAYRASILPQQGLSRKVISWIYAIPNCYLLFDKKWLNKIACKGVTIIAQDDEDSNVYIRHQLTADLNEGIMYYEDSAGVNVDTVCYGIKDIIAPYIGQYNNTEDTLVEIKNRVVDYLLSLTNTGTSADERRIGPQLSGVDLDTVVVALDPNFKDRVVVSADIVVPLPINQIRVHINAYASLANATSGAIA